MGQDLESTEFGDIVYTSQQMDQVVEVARRAAERDVTVLIIGESGTGKEMIAQAIHTNSPRAALPLVALNCAAIPDTLLESEIFGHEAGAFTSAVKDRRGKFELAHQGTLFLDEIGEMTMAAQAKVLRAIETGTFERLGGEGSTTVDVRIIAATNRDPMQAIKDGLFRVDLYYRLNEILITIPPLRERKEDIEVLANHFLEQFSAEYGKDVKRISKAAMDFINRHDWPGNVRELRSVVKSGVVLTDREEIWLEDLPIDFNLNTAEVNALDEQYLSLESVEKRHIAAVLQRTKWNKTKAASLLQISRPRLDRKINQYELRPIGA
ncbi:MAG: sigma-54 interaction domain-containing protein [Planctomycetota bacterium]